ncbi:MAG: replicative DNA helicase [Bacteroidota bacterium]
MAKQETYKKTTQKKKEITELDFGKMPPHSIDLEETVLGQLMLEDDVVVNVIDTLKPESFYVNKHRLIYEAIYNLGKEQAPVNIQTVVEELKKKEKLEEVGGAFFIAQLTQKISSAAHIDHHAKLIAEKFIQRELIRVASEIQEKAFDATLNISELIDFSESEVFKVGEGNVKKAAAPISQLMDKAFELIHKAQDNENSYSGEPTGFTDLDKITSGWQSNNMVVLAARPAMGKTAFVLSMLRNMAVDYNLPVAMFSLEMNSVQLVNRLIVSETAITHDKLKNGKLSESDWTNIYEKTQKLSNAPIYLDDTPALSVFEFRAKCRRLVEKYGVRCVFIDYLQLMTTQSASSREQEVSLISRQIKAVAMELEIPVIALSQLNRSVETRTGNKRPQLSDLRESGAIEQDADLVLFIHRPEYYGITVDEEGNSTVGLAEIIIAKNRHGATSTVNLEFIPEQTKFTDRNFFNQLEDLPDENSDFEYKTQVFKSKMNANDNVFENMDPNSSFKPDKANF